MVPDNFNGDDDSAKVVANSFNGDAEPTMVVAGEIRFNSSLDTTLVKFQHLMTVAIQTVGKVRI